jgi:GH15 family glucan-1,4-alpha-glucosidase
MDECLMTSRIEDYAFIGDCRTAALVGRDGSIDWLCVPRFDSPACFAALLGTPEHGRWRVAPSVDVRAVRRCYRPGTLVLETEFETDSGTVAVIDAMAMTSDAPTILRLVEGRRGEVPMRMEWVVRFDYGSIVPWVRRMDGAESAIAGPDKLVLRPGVEVRGEGLTTVADFRVAAGQTVPFALAWHPSHEPAPPPLDVASAIEATARWWCEWSHGCGHDAHERDSVVRSLITLKALTYAPTGGIVAAPTTSLPECLGGVRNWDYRFCWIRDATFTLYSFLISGYLDEARAWRDWLLRAVAGRPASLQIMYGLAGERRLTEWEVPWLPGFHESRPVRIGNAASNQFQLDVYGEVFDVMLQGLRSGLGPLEDGWRMGRLVLEFLETAWTEPDEGIWEVRGGRRPFTHSKVMAWVAFDRAVKLMEQFPLNGPIDHWRSVRDEIHSQVCRNGYDPDRNTFVQSYGTKDLDASLLMIPLVGFLPANDPRVLGTVAAIERELIVDGFVARYRTDPGVDGLPPGEGAFLPCTFWYVDNLTLQGRHDEAKQLFARLLAIRNDVGLLAEEYDPRTGRQLGNFPQAFSHVSLINTAHNLGRGTKPAEHRQHS